MTVFLYIILIMCARSLPTQAHQPREKFRASRSLMVGVGQVHQLDTYLSPIEYKGTGLSIAEEYSRVIDWNDNRATFRSTVQASFAPGSAWKGGNDVIGGDLRHDATWQYHFWIPNVNNLTLKVGGGFNTTIGGLYASHGGNNPAQAHAQLQLLGAFAAEYTIPKKHSYIRYHADLPLLGGMFSPAFGQSYYEIFTRGNYDHNIVLTHPFRDFSLRQQLWMDICLKKKKQSPYFYLRVGYQNEIRQLQPNHLKQKMASNALMVGLVKHF